MDIYKPYTPTLRIGDKAARITDIAANTAQLIEYELPKQKQEILAAASSRMTDMITNATKGYIHIDEELGELLIMDTPSKETATKVWRWNSAGFAYSDHGYNEGYFVGLTADGKILANSILAGLLQGFEIVNGNDTFHVYPNGTVQASALNITGGSIRIDTDNALENVIRLNLSNSGNINARMTPSGFDARELNERVYVSGHGISLFSHYDETSPRSNVTAISISSQSGSILAKGNISGAELTFLRNGSYVSVNSEFNSIRDEIQAIWNAINIYHGGG